MRPKKLTRSLLLLALALTLAVLPACRRRRIAAQRATQTAAAGEAQARVPATEEPTGGAAQEVGAQAGEALFRDDFQDGVADDSWEVQGAWTVQQSGEVYTFNSSGQGFAWVRGGGEWTDYAYRAAVRRASGDINLVFRLTEEGNYLARFTPEGAALLRYSAGEYTTLGQSNLILSPDEGHVVVVAAQGGRLVVRVDDVTVLDATDPTPLLQGTVGVSSTEGSQAAIDNVIVIALAEGAAVAEAPAAGREGQAPGAGVIQSFTTDDEIITAGQCTNLRWQVAGAVAVTINGQEVSGDWLEVCPRETTSYLLRAGDGRAMVAVEVLSPPVAASAPPSIVEFDADEPFLIPSQTTFLRWQVEGAQQVYLDGQRILRRESFWPIQPAETTTYRLRAENVLGADEAEFTVQVEAPEPPVIHEFDADDPTVIPPDLTTTLRWHVTGADLVKLITPKFPGGIAMSEPNWDVTVRQTTEYILAAYVTGSDQPVTRSLTVEVGEPRFTGPPEIVVFDADHPFLEQGQPQEIGAGCTVLRWQAANATQIVLSGEGDVSALTDYEVCPRVTTTYTLSAGRPGVQELAQATATVQVGQTQGAGAGEYLEILDVRQLDAQTAEVTVSYGLTPGHAGQVRLIAKAMVWNDLAEDGPRAEALPQFQSQPPQLQTGQRQVTLTLSYRGWQTVVSDHMKVEMVEVRETTAADETPEERIAETFLSTAYEHQDMLWEPINRIYAVRAWRGLLANELNVLVAYFYTGDHGDDVRIGARPIGGGVDPAQAGYVPAHAETEGLKLARVTVRYDGGVAVHSDQLRVFMHRQGDPERFEVLDVPFAHDWSASDIRILGVQRAQPDDVSVPRGALLVEVAYALNNLPEAQVQFSAMPEAGSPVAYLTVPEEQRTIYQGHGEETFLVYYDGYQTVETDLLKAALVVGGGGGEAEFASHTRPVTNTWQSTLLTQLGGGWECRDQYVPITALGAGRWTLSFESAAACFAALAPCDEQKRDRHDNPALFCSQDDILRISSPNVEPDDDRVNEPIEVQYIGSPDLTVHARAGDLSVPGMPVTVTPPDGASQTRCTRPDGDAVFYGLGEREVTVSIHPAEAGSQCGLQQPPDLPPYTKEDVPTGLHEVHDVNLAPAYVVVELEAVTFARDEDLFVDEWFVTTKAHTGTSQTVGYACQSGVDPGVLQQQQIYPCQPNVWPYFTQENLAQAAWYEAQGGDVLYPHLPVFAFPEHLMRDSLMLSVTGVENDTIAKEWLIVVEVFQQVLQWGAQIVGTVYGVPALGSAVGAVNEAVDALFEWLNEDERLGSAATTLVSWPDGLHPYVQDGGGQVGAQFLVHRVQPTPGRNLSVVLNRIHVHDDGDSWPSGVGDITLYTRVCNGYGCSGGYHEEWKVDDGEVLTLDMPIFGYGVGEGESRAGPYLYIEVGVWDDDGWADNNDMLGTVSILLTEDEEYGVGAPITLYDSGYDEGAVTVELEVTSH